MGLHVQTSKFQIHRLRFLWLFKALRLIYCYTMKVKFRLENVWLCWLGWLRWLLWLFKALWIIYYHIDYDIHFSSSILPPLVYRDEPVDSSLDDLLLSSIILDSSLSDKTHTLSPGHAKMKAKSSSQSTKHEQMIDRLELDIIACNKQPPDRYSTCMYELDVASLPIQPSTQVRGRCSNGDFWEVPMLNSYLIL